jgi:hypothetical protein
MHNVTQAANDDDIQGGEEAAIAIEALLLALETLILQPDAKKIISHLKIIELLAREAMSALRNCTHQHQGKYDA